MSSLLPPEYANIPARLLYQLELPTSIRLTAMKIYGLGWRHRYERTDPVTLDELMDICEVGRSTLYGHLATLGDKRVLRYTTVNVGSSRTFVFELLITGSESPDRGPPGASPENWTNSTIHDVVDPSVSDRYKKHHEQQQQQATYAVEGGSGGKHEPSGKPDARSEILDAMGVAEPTRSRLLARDHVTAGYATDWRAWFESQDELGIGWVITQMQVGVEPPETREECARAQRQQYLEWGG